MRDNKGNMKFQADYTNGFSTTNQHMSNNYKEK